MTIIAQRATPSSRTKMPGMAPSFHGNGAKNKTKIAKAIRGKEAMSNGLALPFLVFTLSMSLPTTRLPMTMMTADKTWRRTRNNEEPAQSSEPKPMTSV